MSQEALSQHQLPLVDEEGGKSWGEPKFVSTNYGVHIVAHKGMPTQEGSPVNDKDILNIDLLPVDIGNNSSYLIAAILNAHTKKVWNGVKFTNTLFGSSAHYGLLDHMSRVGEMLKTERYTEQGYAFAVETANQISQAFKAQNVPRLELFYRCLDPDEEGADVDQFGILRRIFPKFNEIIETKFKMQDLVRFGTMSTRTGAFNAVLEGLEQNETIKIKDVVLRVLRVAEISDKQLDDFDGDGEIYEAVTFQDLVTEAEAIYRWIKGAKVFGRDALEQGKWALERLILLQEIDVAFRLHQKEILQTEAKRIKGEAVEKSVLIEALMANPDILVDPKDFGLRVNEGLSRLIRREVPIKGLDIEQCLTEPEREVLEGRFKALHISRGGSERDFETKTFVRMLNNYLKERVFLRVMHLSPEEISANPEGYYKYQRALVRRIAYELRVPVDKSVDVPLPQGLRSITNFREQERILKEYSDWHYLLLYPEVQKVFLEMLPFCGVPPVSPVISEHTSNPSLTHSELYFAWRTPTRTKEWIRETLPTINEISFLNYYDPEGRGLCQTIIGQFISGVLREEGFTFIPHGLARAFFDPDLRLLINQSGYVAFNSADAEVAPDYDVDMIVLSNRTREITPGVIASAIAKRKASYLIGGTLKGRSMRGLEYGFISKRSKKHTLKKGGRIGEDKNTILQALRGWMGRDMNESTDLLALTLLSVAKMRSFGLVPFRYRIGKHSPFFVKAVDIFGGFMDYPMDPVQRKKISFVSPEDAFPEGKTYSYWLFFRTFADSIWMIADMDGEQIRSVMDRLYFDWEELSKSPGVADIIFEDLEYEAGKALTKALTERPERTWTHITRIRTENSVSFSSFFPNLHRLTTDDQIREGIEVNLRDDYVTDPSGKRKRTVDEVVKVIMDTEGVREIYEKNNPKGLTEEKWLLETIFKQPD